MIIPAVLRVNVVILVVWLGFISDGFIMIPQGQRVP